MTKRVQKFISRYSMFERGQRVGVAVSGGADSVCLLHVLLELAPHWALKLRILHLDHGLRGEESRADAEFVREMAARLGLPVYIDAADVARIRADRKENLEQAARRIRRDFFLGFLKAGLVDRVALGHTRSDQAETVLFRLLRGSGPTGIAGILPVTPEGFVRPLLDVDREEVEQFLRDRGIPWREDSTNRDTTFARNRIRHELLPALARDWNPAISETLARMAMLAQDDEEYWRTEIDRLAASHLTKKFSAVLLRTEPLGRMAPPVARRLVRRAIEWAKGGLAGVDFGHVEQVLSLAEGREGHGRIQLPGVDVFRSFDWLRLTPPEGAAGRPQDYDVPLSVPGRFAIPGSSLAICLELLENKLGLSSGDSGYNVGGELDWTRISGPLQLRNWRPGDQYRPIGHASEEKIKLLFQEGRVPLWERRGWPVITSGEKILWTRRFGPAADYAATPESRLVLKVEEIEHFSDSGNLPADS